MQEYREMTSEDRRILLAERKMGTWEVIMVLVGLFIAVPAYFYYFDDFEGRAMLLYYTICTVICVGLGLLVRATFKEYRMDLEQRRKLTGVTTLKSKTRIPTKSGTTHYFFELELDGLKELRVERETFQRFAQGDPIYIEVAVHSKKVLRATPPPESPYRGV